MTWTYSEDPTTSTRDEVRWLVGDTDSSDPQVSDEEIDYVLGKYDAGYPAATIVAQAIAAKYAKKADKTVGSLSLNWSQKRDAYVALAERLNGQATTGVLGPGGLVGAPRFSGGGQTYLGNDFQ